MVRYDLNPQHHRTDEAPRREYCSSAVDPENSSQCKEPAHSLRSDVTTNYPSSRNSNGSELVFFQKFLPTMNPGDLIVWRGSPR